MKDTERRDRVLYENRFQESKDVESYESEIYGADSYSSVIWEIQRPVLQKILNEFRMGTDRQVTLLDFACGTGRVTSFVENFADVAVGLDISPGMVRAAESKTVKTEFVVGDVLSNCEMPHSPYDVITSFRFLLNADAEIRRRVLLFLRQVIHEPDGLLVVNMHGNSHSIRRPVIAWKRWRETRGKSRDKPGAMLNEMSPNETRHLLSETGFEVVEQIGFGIMPGVFYRTPLKGLSAAIDRYAARRGWGKNWAIDLLFICRPIIHENGV